MEKPSVGQGMQGSTTPSTTFVQANTNNFRELVQRLTGPSDHMMPNVPPQLNNVDGFAAKVVGVKKPSFKLHERRQYTSKSKLEIVRPPCSPFIIRSRTPSPGSNSSRISTTNSKTESNKFSPSSKPVGFNIGSPSNTFSNLSIFEEDQTREFSNEEEEKAIKERRFYLRPPTPSSKSSGGISAEPELLTLFPLTSPKSREP